jgi:hypothetical protein
MHPLNTIRGSLKPGWIHNKRGEVITPYSLKLKKGKTILRTSVRNPVPNISSIRSASCSWWTAEWGRGMPE